MEKLREGDRVEYIGPVGEEADDPTPGELGWAVSESPGDQWLVDWDSAGDGVYPGRYLKATGRNEPDPDRRARGDPFGP
jgi:hypothetical protein